MSTDPERTDEERERLKKEEVIGIIPATVFSGQDLHVHCGIVFATNVLILARLLNFKDIYFAEKIAGGRYYALQREWTGYLHKPVKSIMESKNYQCYILPYSNVTHVSATETGRFRKRTTLVFHTEKQDFAFHCVTSREIVAKDLTGFLRGSGVRFSLGGMT
jgi:hypothetical protein